MKTKRLNVDITDVGYILDRNKKCNFLVVLTFFARFGVLLWPDDQEISSRAQNI